MPNRTVNTERRKELRKRPLGLVYVELSSSNGGMLRDLSEKGFAMRAMRPLRLGDSTSFAFSLDPETRLEGQCKVLWVEEEGRVAGLQFTSIPEELPRCVRVWLRANSFVIPQSSLPAKSVAQETSTLQELRDELRSSILSPQNRDIPEKKSAAFHPVADSKGEPTPVLERVSDVEQAKIEPLAVEVPEPIPEAPELVQVPKLEPLPVLSEMAAIPEPAILNRGYARSGIALAIRMMIGLALLACAVVYHRPLGNAIIWLGQKIAGSDSPEISYTPKSDESSQQTGIPASTPNSSAPTADASNAGAAAPDQAASPVPPQKDIEVPPVVENTSPQPVKNPSIATAPATPPVPLPTVHRTTTYSTPPAGASDQPGEQEYLAAQDILKNKNTEAGLPEAVRLLWDAVKKGNSSAEVTLAELYRTGQGVSKSCDQTKILLTAAAKKGNLEAQEHLEQFLKEGCE